MAFLAPLIGFASTAISGISSFIAGLGFFGKLAIGIGLNIASAAIQKALQKKNQPQTQPTGAILQKEYGAVVPRRVLMGLVGLSGHDCYVNSWGAANGALQQLFVLSDYPCDGLNRVGINGTWTATDAGGGAFPNLGSVVSEGPFSGKIWFKFHDGTQTTANADLIARANPSGRWSAAHKGIGVCYVIATFVFDPDELNSLPDFFFEVRGARLYDWRLDSTNGGSGSHRWGWANYSTHAWSENPIVMAYSVKRGLSVGDDLFCGMDMPAGDLPVAKWTAAANICDETTEGEDRYRCSLAVECGPETTHGDNIEALLLSCGGMMVEAIDGSWPLVGSDQPTVADLTDDDLVAGAQVKYREKRSMSDLVNAVSGKFADPNLLWAFDDYEPQISSAALVVDRRTRDVGIDFPMVRSKRQAGQLANIYLEDNRYEAQATALFKPRWLVLEPGDWITWRSKTWLVTDVTIVSLDEERARCAQLSLKQVDGAIYDGIANPNIIFPTPPGDPEYLEEVDFSLAAITVEETDGGLRPGIRISWPEITDTTVTGVEVRWWPTAQPTVVMSKTVLVPATADTLIAGVVSRTEYSVDTKLMTAPGRLVARSAAKTVVTLSAPSSDVTVYLTALQAEIRNYLKARQVEFDDTLERLRVFAANVASSNTEDVASRTMQAKSVGDAFARILEENRLRVSADEAFAEQITLVEARIDNTEADIAAQAVAFGVLTGQVTVQGGLITANANAITGVQAQITGINASLSGQALSISQLSSVVTSQGNQITAQATALTAVTATANDATASGLMRWRATSGPGGASVRFALEAKVTSGASYRFAGIYLDVTAAQSKLLFIADQFIVSDGATDTFPFIYVGGVLTLKTMRAQTLISARLESLDGTKVIDMSAGYLDFRF